MTGFDELSAALGDRYTIERLLGQGGMATVYLTRDHQHDRLVALKAIHPELTSVLGDDRFRREIRLVAQLHHPHIVPVFDSGEADGRLWFTMPFVEGESLRARLDREGGLPFADIARIAAQVAAALDEAHRRGILHRDVKPENILLTPGGDALLSDFGVARPVQRGTGATLTADGFAVGTPAYMSPEQAMGNTVLDGRSDVYALGCVVYELLTGEPPHLGTSAQNIMIKRMTDAPPSARTLRPTIPPAWDAALARALAVAPADRFATAGEFVAALVATGPAGEQGARVAGQGGRAGRVGFITALALMAALAVGAVLVRRYVGALPLDRTLLAVLPFRVATADTALAYLGEGMVDLLAVKFTGEGGPRAVDPRASNAAWLQAGRRFGVGAGGRGAARGAGPRRRAHPGRRRRRWGCAAGDDQRHVERS